MITQPQLTMKQRYLLLRLAAGIESKHLIVMCQAWGVDAVCLPLGRGIDGQATLQRLAQYVLNEDS